MPTGYANRNVDDLERWQETGGKLRVVELSSERAVIDLCACTGETMERWSTDDPALIVQVQRLLPDAGAEPDTD
jgi:hypothetical protein